MGGDNRAVQPSRSFSPGFSPTRPVSTEVYPSRTEWPYWCYRLETCVLLCRSRIGQTPSASRTLHCHVYERWTEPIDSKGKQEKERKRRNQKKKNKKRTHENKK